MVKQLEEQWRNALPIDEKVRQIDWLIEQAKSKAEKASEGQDYAQQQLDYYNEELDWYNTVVSEANAEVTQHTEAKAKLLTEQGAHEQFEIAQVEIFTQGAVQLLESNPNAAEAKWMMQRLKEFAAEALGTLDVAKQEEAETDMELDEDGLPELNWTAVAELSVSISKEVEEDFEKEQGDAAVDLTEGQTRAEQKNESFNKRMKEAAKKKKESLVMKWGKTSLPGKNKAAANKAAAAKPTTPPAPLH